MYTLLHPAAAAPHGALMAAAAACGDFEEWPAWPAGAHDGTPEDAPLKLDLALQAIGAAAGGDAPAYEAALAALPALLAPGGCVAASFAREIAKRCTRSDKHAFPFVAHQAGRA